jgi:hypothetical protein
MVKVPKYTAATVPTTYAGLARVPDVHRVSDHYETIRYYLKPYAAGIVHRLWRARANSAYNSKRLGAISLKGMKLKDWLLASKYQSLIQTIFAIITRSEILEDPIHSIDTLEWLLEIEPHADMALRIAAVGHDIDSSIGGLRIYRTDFVSYELYRQAHMRRSSAIVKALMEIRGFDVDLVEDVFSLVRNHEYGGSEREDLLKDADSLSYFRSNLPFFFEKFGYDKTRARCKWEYARLSPRARAMFSTIRHEGERLNGLMMSIG